MTEANAMQRAVLKHMWASVAQPVRLERARKPPETRSLYQEEQRVPKFKDRLKAHYNITAVKKRQGVSIPQKLLCTASDNI